MVVQEDVELALSHKQTQMNMYIESNYSYEKTEG